MKKAIFAFRAGYLILLPKHAQACQLWLEFVTTHQAENRAARRSALAFKIYDAALVNPAEEEFFYIRMPTELKQTFLEAVEYINANLPVEAA